MSEEHCFPLPLLTEKEAWPPRRGCTVNELSLVRVYIKRQEDYDKCRAVCEARLGQWPSIYAVADVCRPELLVAKLKARPFARLVAKRLA
jgi:hypothetical protein